MVATQPKFNVSFKDAALLAIQQQERGEVVIILKDTTSEIDRKTYRGLGEVQKTDYTTANYDRLTLAFMGNPTKVTVIKEEVTEVENQEVVDITATLAKLDNYDNYILCYPTATDTEFVAIKNYLYAVRGKNNYSIAIEANPATAPDAQYIVNFVGSNIKAVVNGSEKTFTAGDYTARIAGALSGLPATRSLTYYELSELVDCDLQADEDDAVEDGKLIIIHQDGEFKFGRAVNSLTTLTDGITESFQKIRIINTMDTIANDVVATFRKNYVGKYVNNFTNKNRFAGAINAYLHDRALEGLLDIDNDNAVQVSFEKNKAYLEGKGIDTSKMTYIEILKANTGSKVLLDGVCSPTDTMEDLDLGMYLFQALQAE